jgi:hypothetical protein
MRKDNTRSYITVQKGAEIVFLASNRQVARDYVVDELIKQGIPADACRIRVTNNMKCKAGAYRVFSYGALRDLINSADAADGEGVDIGTYRPDTIMFRLQRHLVNGGA